MQNKESFVTNLIIIYLALVFLVGGAVYALIIHFYLDITLATNILIWTATLFATIALLYTFNSWSRQKGIEVLSIKSEEVYSYIHGIYQLLKKINNFSNNEEIRLKIIDFRNSKLEKLNIYLSILENIKQNDLQLKLKRYDILLSLFDNNYFDSVLFDKHKEELLRLSEEIENEIVNFILYNRF